MMSLRILLAFFLPLSLSAQLHVHTNSYIDDVGSVPREHSVDMTHMKLQVSFEPGKGLVNGVVTHYFKPIRKKVDSIFFDGPGISVQSASLNGKPVNFKISREGVTVFPQPHLTWESSDSIVFKYSATPKKGIYFIGWNDPKGLSQKQIWTQGQGIDNRHWIPMYDSQNDKLTTEIIVTFPEPYKVLSNGTLINKTSNGNEITWHYKMMHPHASYLVMLGIGEYEIQESVSKSGVPMQAWYYPGLSKERVALIYKHSEEMMDFFEAETGVPYPWESYAQIPVQDFMYGAMENTTATLFGDFYLIDNRSWNDRNYVATNAHELAHQWFGDYVTARSFTHHWLQESFATYYSLLFDKEVFGQDYFDWGRREDQLAAFNESKKNTLPIAHSNAGSARWYPKGAMVLHMLRYVLGEEQYKKGITHYLQKHPYGNVDSEDLLVSFHESMGYSLDWFWEQWVYHGGEPHYQVSARDVQSGGVASTEFNISQIQPVNALQGVFRMPVWLKVFYQDGSADSSLVWVDQLNQSVSVPNPGNKKVAYTLFDPGRQILAKVTFPKSDEQLKAQAVKARFVLDRYDAVEGLVSKGIASNYDFFSRIMQEEKHHGPKEAIINQAVKENGKQSLSLLKLALRDKDIQVRKSVVRALERVPAELRKDYEALLTDESYEVIETTLNTLSYQFPEKRKDYLEQTKGIEGTRGHNVLVKWLEIKALDDTSAIRRLSEMTSGSYEFITRVNAMNALVRLGELTPKAMDNMIEAGTSSNNRLAGPAIQALEKFMLLDKNRKQLEAYYRSVQLNPEQRKVVEGLIY